MNIQMRNPKDLVPYINNAKKHDKTQIANVAESIKQYGFVQPVVVDAEGVIVIGHCRVEAAKKLKLKEVPCVCVDDLTPEQVNALRIVDNKSNESAWDLDLLKLDLAEVDLRGFDFDFGIPDEIIDEVAEDGYEVQLPKEPKAKLGDIYMLGQHRLMCGDSTVFDNVAALMNGNLADLLITDPPYNVNYEGSAGKIKNDNMKDAEFRSFLESAFANARDAMKPGAPFYIWHADSEGYNFRGSCRDVGLVVRQCLIWVKNTFVLGRQDYQWRHEPCLYGEAEVIEDEHEPCLYGWRDGGKHYFFKNRKQTTILEFDKPRKSSEHPTMKPIKLFDYQMQCSSKRGDIVLDLFGGSGTAIMACEQNGRICYTMEYDPAFVDVIIDRWQKFTGKKAQKIEG